MRAALTRPRWVVAVCAILVAGPACGDSETAGVDASAADSVATDIVTDTTSEELDSGDTPPDAVADGDGPEDTDRADVEEVAEDVDVADGHSPDADVDPTDSGAADADADDAADADTDVALDADAGADASGEDVAPDADEDAGDAVADGDDGGDTAVAIDCAEQDTACVRFVRDGASGVCVPIDRPPGTVCDDGDGCTLNDTCASGVCVPGTALACRPPGPCEGPGVCAPATGTCAFPTLDDGVTCGDGDPCTTDDVCTGGICAGTARDCDDNVACTLDACDPGAGSCVHDPAPCECQSDDDCDDHDDCTGDETCDPDLGTCVAGTRVDCSQFDTACLRGTCDQDVLGFCTAVPRDDGLLCDDGSGCTVDDACHDGICWGVPRSCPAGGPCGAPGFCDLDSGVCAAAPAEGSTCSDGDACTTVDTCQGGACVGEGAKVCPAGDACRFPATCNPVSGACSQTNRADATPCDDGDACSVGDACSGGVCAPGAPMACLEGGPCAVDAPGACEDGVCQYEHRAQGSRCDDGDPCTLRDACDATGGCVGAPVTCTTPGAACRVPVGVCGATGACEYAAADDGTGCDDGDACTDDSCHGGVCVGAPVVCDNDDPDCTVVACVAATGCVPSPRYDNARGDFARVLAASTATTATHTRLDDGTIAIVGTLTGATQFAPTLVLATGGAAQGLYRVDLPPGGSVATRGVVFAEGAVLAADVVLPQSDAGLIVAGSFNGAVRFGTGETGVDAATSGTVESFVARFDADGHALWVRLIRGGILTGVTSGSVHGANGNVAFAGISALAPTFDGVEPPTTLAGGGTWVAVYGADGTLMMATRAASVAMARSVVSYVTGTRVRLVGVWDAASVVVGSGPTATTISRSPNFGGAKEGLLAVFELDGAVAYARSVFGDVGAGRLAYLGTDSAVGVAAFTVGAVGAATQGLPFAVGGTDDVALYTFNDAGSPLKQVVIGGSGQQELLGLTSAGGSELVALVRSTGELAIWAQASHGPGAPTTAPTFTASSASDEVFILKCRADGSLVWAHSLGLSGAGLLATAASQLTLDEDDGAAFVLTGHLTGATTALASSPWPLAPNGTAATTFVMRVDSEDAWEQCVAD
ncbi:MAG: hypothetical protein KC635_17325 [Myxococcales bacterium]|nr:hypothetical protein [Myxococcales bacterium]MCB9735897.1 hypothetical protein [Deltaproteobacteria bacterium]